MTRWPRRAARRAPPAARAARRRPARGAPSSRTIRSRWWRFLRRAGAGAVEVDDVQEARAGLHPRLRRLDRVVLVDRLLGEVALDEPDRLALGDVDRGIEDHALPRRRADAGEVAQQRAARRPRTSPGGTARRRRCRARRTRRTRCRTRRVPRTTSSSRARPRTSARGRRRAGSGRPSVSGDGRSPRDAVPPDVRQLQPARVEPDDPAGQQPEALGALVLLRAARTAAASRGTAR